MSTSETPKVSAASFDAEVAALRNAASTSIDPCLVAKLIAVSDSRVRDLFLRKLADNYVFRGIYCLDQIAIPEIKSVIFDFGCQPGTLCLIPPAFKVVINFIDRYVVAIVDNYIPTASRPTGSTRCGCHDRPGRSTARLRTGCVDVTIEDGKACLNVPFAGSVCISVPNNVPNGTVAEACIDTCSEWGVLCGVEVAVRVAGVEVASASWGCC